MKDTVLKNYKKTKLVPPEFTENKFAEILHFTDIKENPSFQAYKSKAFYKLFCGAKGVSKSFNAMIETIYRIVNEKIFCSIWCRNQYNHIKNTLRPMFEKVLDFLANEHGLDYRPFFDIYANGVYWNFEDGGSGRGIFFENWESIQAFQGITLKKSDFRFGEIVIDEPIEDPTDSKANFQQLQEIYALQEEKLPLLLDNTILRQSTPEGFKINVKFCYNIFTTDHFLIQNYHNKIINLVNENGEVNNDNLEKLIDKKFLQKEDLAFKNNTGIIVSMFSKMFVPAKLITNLQIKQWEELKNDNPRLWAITVAGFAFQTEDNLINYFLKNLIFNANGELENRLLPEDWDFKDSIKKNKIIAIYDGFDAGKSDKASWCRILLTNTGSLIVYDLIDDLKTKNMPKDQIRALVNDRLIESILKSNEELGINDSENLPGILKNWHITIFTDNDIIAESLNEKMKFKNIKNGICTLAKRRDSKSDMFGIENRQEWQKWILENDLLFFLPRTHHLLINLAKQAILSGETKRDETINREIYDTINAFEMASCIAYKIQFNIRGAQYE